MRRFVIPLLLAACEPQLTPKPLPQLIVPPRPVAVSSGALWIVPGEHLIWEVSSGELTIGRAELVTREHEMESRFATDGFASMFAAVHHELTTPIDYGLHVHTIHSALAWLRAWTPRDQAPAVLEVELDGDRYHVACEPPMADELHDTRVDRIACEIQAPDAIAVTLWLSTDSARVPLRLLARTGTFHVAADLVAH
jgi:hypothetical protein